MQRVAHFSLRMCVVIRKNLFTSLTFMISGSLIKP